MLQNKEATDVHLVDGTYELFRHYFVVPARADVNGNETGAVRAVLSSILSMVEGGATHIGVATDHVIESFRNELYSSYKTGAGLPEDLVSQFPVLEDALEAMGIVVWRMIRYEADDALASAAAKAAGDSRVNRIVICTPDKDLSQCVDGTRIVQLDRRTKVLRDEAGVVAKFGVGPKSIPDYLALVGDSADGFPGIPGWGARSAACVLSRFRHLEDIPRNWKEWHVPLRNIQLLANTLFRSWDDALLFRTLATLRTDLALFDSVDALEWKGPAVNSAEVFRVLRSEDLLDRCAALRR